ncbi:hypothetical protein [Planococcus versutus]|uniref:Uncharacterized protein n=1 Tax=Planococcus versutus TaxID=1302659 RepID=A0A1B1RXH4_9BACL|nr:hypothetical protein [Planococcus versutus]ANU25633.1 hypothetical protein I858_000890 [Planococcus versutus]
MTDFLLLQLVAVERLLPSHESKEVVLSALKNALAGWISRRFGRITRFFAVSFRTGSARNKTV